MVFQLKQHAYLISYLTNKYAENNSDRRICNMLRNMHNSTYLIFVHHEGEPIQVFAKLEIPGCLSTFCSVTCGLLRYYITHLYLTFLC